MTTKIRQSQLISPFGVGSCHVTADGVSLITAGLDYWFRFDNLDLTEFKISEPRLQKMLRVNHFRYPPDFRERRNITHGPVPINTNLQVPFFRFPVNYFCQNCNHIQTLLQFDRERATCIKCNKQKLVPLPLIAICDQGHAEEFPWSKWVHRSKEELDNTHELKFIKEAGNPGLEGLWIQCSCGAKRSLGGVTTAHNEQSTRLSQELTNDQEEFLCSGSKPWMGIKDGSGCGRPVRGSLRSASNLYFPIIRSSIFIPFEGISDRLMQIYDNNSGLRLVIAEFSDVSILKLKSMFPELKEFSDKELISLISLKTEINDAAPEEDIEETFQQQQQKLREEEFEVLSQNQSTPDLKTISIASEKYEDDFSKFFSSISLVEKLRETRVLSGFARIFPEGNKSNKQLLEMMWKEVPPPLERWLPATLVFGEGIFFEFNRTSLQRWEQQSNVLARTTLLKENYSRAQRIRKLHPKDELSARFILIHTLAHALINEITYEAGYSTASLRERLYVDQKKDGMAGLLIYTAAGDSDGTLGGLVDLGRPGKLEGILHKAVERARWCSTDPICMEIGERVGQGPDNCNLAACHNCGLVPETACEEFNRFLDRGLLIGSTIDEKLGFFNL